VERSDGTPVLHFCAHAPDIRLAAKPVTLAGMAKKRKRRRQRIDTLIDAHVWLRWRAKKKPAKRKRTKAKRQ